MTSKSDSHNTTGFTTVGIAAAIVVVVAIALASFLVLRPHDKPTPVAKAKQTSVATKPANPCLTLAELQGYAYAPIDKINQDTPIARVYFKPDVTDYNPTLMPSGKPVGESANKLYISTSKKDYQFTVTASTSEESTSESGQQLAAARADKVKGELVARGIPAEKITILPPTHGLAGGDLTRYAYIGVRVPDACVTK